MSFFRHTFTSKVARRTFLLFAGCALLPISLFSLIALRQVTTELLGQSDRHLRQTTKATGMLLHRRLLELKALITAPPAGPAEANPAILGRASIAADGRARLVSGQIADLSAVRPSLDALEAGQFLFFTRPSKAGAQRLFIAYHQRGPATGFQLVEANPAFLWNHQDAEALGANTTLTVLDESGRTPILQSGGVDSLPPATGSASSFEWSDGTTEYLAGRWTLFLRSDFAGGNWIITLSRAKGDVLRAITDFHRTFLVVGLLSLLVVLFLSIGQIRKTLGPLARLQQATNRIAQGHLDERVELPTRDEFAELGQSFNQMSGQLARQFDALAMRSEITIALSRSEPTSDVLRLCTEILGRHLRLSSAGVWLAGTEDGWLELLALSGCTPDDKSTPQRIRIGEGELGRIAAEGRPAIANTLPVAFVGHPLVIEDRVQGVAAVYATRPLDGIDLAGIAAACGEIAQGIARRRATESLRSSEEQVRQLQKMEAVGRLTGGIAHDFNNLLTVMMCSSHVLATGMSPDDPRHRMAAILRDTAQRGARLTHQLLAFSRKQALAPTMLDLNAVVADCTTLLERMIGETITLSIVPGSDIALVTLDRGQIEQVIVNLVVNARDAMPKGGQITISTARIGPATPVDGPAAARGVTLTVADTGTGMDAATQAKIFEPFFTTKAAGKGTGLGLATVQGIVAQAGGTIRVESQLGQGTRFILTFPPATGTVVAAAEVAAPAARGVETVLLVEDEYDVRTLLEKILTDHGYTVLNAAHPAEALRAAESHTGPIDLLVTDMVMPEMDGRTLAHRLRTLRPGLPVLRISGYTDVAVLGAPEPEGGDSFLQKPFAPEVFARRVREMLDAAKTPDLARRAA